MNYKGFETKSIHAGYEVDKTTNSITPPLYLTNAYAFDSTEHAKNLFELSEAGNIYTRLMNPTTDVLEKRVAELDGGVAAVAFASGHSAIFNTMINLANAGDEIVSSNAIYGGAINMLGVSLDRLGITVKFVDPTNLEEWKSAITDKTKALFTEVIGNPNANISDLSAIADIAHQSGVPFVVDSTFTTPYLCKPIEFGADIVIHSATKFLGGHSTVMGGIVVDSGNFNYKNNPRFPLYNDPDVSYHGMIFADLGAVAFIMRLRTLGLRDIGGCISPFNSFMILQGIETLALRMQRHCENAFAVAKFLSGHKKVKTVNYAGLPNSKDYALAQKYCPKGVGSVFTFEIDGTREDGATFIDSLELLQNVANVGEIRSLVIHPATTTHSQLSEQQLIDAKISAQTIRLSIGIESIEDILADLEQALSKIN